MNPLISTQVVVFVDDTLDSALDAHLARHVSAALAFQLDRLTRIEVWVRVRVRY